MMKSTLRLLGLGLILLIMLTGCRKGIQSDLKIVNANFGSEGGGKNRFYGTVENTGSKTYKSVFIVVDLYENEDYIKQLETSANLFGQNTLTPGRSVTFEKNFDDGGFKPNRYELVRLYGLQ